MLSVLSGLLGLNVGAVDNYKDAHEIINKQAVAETTRLGLFSGSEGKFMPKATVNRAQMAAIIVKMLFGAEVNADPFKGKKTFNDVADFEGGWAEGYINLCAQVDIVSGYGDGSFRPGAPVNTAEVAAMIINVLEVDAGPGGWPQSVMTKAGELGLFGELPEKPAADEALIRDKLAVLVLQGVSYEPLGRKGYIQNGKLYQPRVETENAAGAPGKGKYELPILPA